MVTIKGVLTGIKSLKKMAESGSDGGGSGFLRLQDGQSVTLRFLQELDSDGKFYSEDQGLAISLFEHSDPDNFRQRFLCTSDEEGQCVGCERVVVNSRWKKRSRLYVNVWVVEDKEVKILATGFSPKGVGQSLIEYAEDFHTLMDRTYKMKRSGEKLNTQYALFPKDQGEFDFDYDSNKLHDLSNLAKYRTYDECVALLEGREERR